MIRLPGLVVVASFALGGLAAQGGASQDRPGPAPIVLKMRGSHVISQTKAEKRRAAKHAKVVRRPSGWQPGGPLKPLYQSAVEAIHMRQFDRAEELCRRGLGIAPGDKAFSDLQSQIPQWRRDTTQGKISRIYNDAVTLVRRGEFKDAEELCHQGLDIEPGNSSFRTLLEDIADKRNASLQHKLLVCYRESSSLMSQGRLREAEARCREGLQLQPDDAVLKSLLKRIRERENSGG